MADNRIWQFRFLATAQGFPRPQFDFFAIGIVIRVGLLEDEARSRQILQAIHLRL